MNMEAGCIVRSLAGHDKGSYYLVVQAEQTEVSICDGRLRRVADPKRKNKKHVVSVGKDEALAARLLEGRTVQDEEVKRALKMWKAYHA